MKITDDEIKTIPEQEAWLYMNQAALDSVLEGVKAAAEGRVHYAGSFAQYLDLDIDENTGEKDNGPA